MVRSPSPLWPRGAKGDAGGLVVRHLKGSAQSAREREGDGRAVIATPEEEAEAKTSDCRYRRYTQAGGGDIGRLATLTAQT